MVVMPEYLITTPKQAPSKPRIISEVKKNCFSKLKLSFTTSLQDFGKSKYSGQLLWNTTNSEWALRTAEVRQGSLILINRETSAVDLRQPLRELNLRPCNTPRTFCLVEANGVGTLKFQALTEEEYEKWVRILAVELIRQTPLQNVRFLDILSIIRNKEPDKTNLRKGRSEECIPKADDKIWDQPKPRVLPTVKETFKPEPKEDSQDRLKPEKLFEKNNTKIKITYQYSVPVSRKENSEVKKYWMRTQSMNNLAKSSEEATKQLSDESGISSGDETLLDSVVRNVDNFSFLSVRERKNFFESLNSEPDAKGIDSTPLVRSNSISNFKQTHYVPDRNRLHKRKRTKSLHDLHKTPVREMCQLFESQDNSGRQLDEAEAESAVVALSHRRLQRGERKLEKLKNQIAEVEETIKTVAEDIKSLGTETLKRKEGLEIFAALQKRLDEENSRLDRLQEEMTRVIKGNQRTMMKLERCTEKRY